MKLKAVVASLDEVDEKYHDLYTERNGQFELTGVEGMKTQADVDRLQKAVEKEREAHKSTKEKYSFLNDYDLDEAKERLENYDELEAKTGEIDEEKVNKLVEARVKREIAPLERENKQLKIQNEELGGKVQSFEKKDNERSITDNIRDAAQKLKIRDTAVDDAITLGLNVFERDEDGNVVTKDGIGVTPGVQPEVWLEEMQERRPHWWPENQGAGARGNRTGGGGGFNPFTAENWNLSEQGKLVRSNPEKANQMAKAAGTSVGGPKPEKKS